MSKRPRLFKNLLNQDGFNIFYSITMYYRKYCAWKFLLPPVKSNNLWYVCFKITQERSQKAGEITIATIPCLKKLLSVKVITFTTRLEPPVEHSWFNFRY